MIKFEHSIFALPFAYLGLFFAAEGLPPWRTFLWVTMAMVSIRTGAMALNRLIDHSIDAENPRTKSRALPAGLLTRPFTWTITLLAIAFFLFSTYQLNALCFYLSPIPILTVWIYPYAKKWTWLSHWILGLTLAMAPYGGWLAVRPEWCLEPAFLSLAVFTWVAGFDIFYSLQDQSFDQAKQLQSVPACFGTERAVQIAQVSHFLTLVAFLGFGLIQHLGAFYWIGFAVVSLLIYREHQLISKFGLAKINEAFFNMNASVSLVIFIASFIELLMSHHV